MRVRVLVVPNEVRRARAVTCHARAIGDRSDVPEVTNFRSHQSYVMVMSTVRYHMVTVVRWPRRFPASLVSIFSRGYSRASLRTLRESVDRSSNARSSGVIRSSRMRVSIHNPRYTIVPDSAQFSAINACQTCVS